MVEGDKSMTSAPQPDTSLLPLIPSGPSDTVSLPAGVMPTAPEETPSHSMTETTIPEEDSLPHADDSTTDNSDTLPATTVGTSDGKSDGLLPLRRSHAENKQETRQTQSLFDSA